MNTTEALNRNALRNPQRLALVDGELRLDWAELRERVARLAGALTRRGIKAGDRVALLLDNSARNIEATYAAQWLGAAIVPINTRWTPQEIGFALADCNAVAVFVDNANQANLRNVDAGVLSGMVQILADVSDVPSDLLDYETLLSDSAPVQRSEVLPEAMSSMFYTGGTTGRSKGVPLSHANQMSHSIAMIAECGLLSATRYLHAAPMFHIADSLWTHIVTLLGGTHVVLRRFAPDAVAEVVQREQVEVTMLVPTMIQMIMSKEDSAARAFGPLKRLFYGASPMPEALLRGLLSSFPALQLCQLYGQTESSPVLTVMPPEWHGLDGRQAAKARSAGRAMIGTEVRIVDADDHEVPVHVMGEIVARGPQVMSGYWQRPEETAAALRGGWLHTGDAGFMDEDGFIYVADRIKDMIITGGENVYSVEVEQAIYQLDGVAQCCVIGLPHEQWGETVHAIVVPKVGCSITEELVKTNCTALLADYKRPRSVTIRFEPLPMSGAGKILKRELRDALRGAQA